MDSADQRVIDRAPFVVDARGDQITIRYGDREIGPIAQAHLDDLLGALVQLRGSLVLEATRRNAAPRASTRLLRESSEIVIPLSTLFGMPTHELDRMRALIDERFTHAIECRQLDRMPEYTLEPEDDGEVRLTFADERVARRVRIT